MKNILLSQIDLKIEELDLAEIKGGVGEVIYSGSGKDGRTGGIAHEFLVIREDDTFYHIYVP